MAELHKALECLRPKDFSDVLTDNLDTFLPEILANAQLIANSVPPPPNGTPYESAQRSRTSPQPALNAADLTVSSVRRPSLAKEHEELHKAWGKPLKLGKQEAATGMSVFKMAGHDRHGAWFSRNSVHEGLGFEKWKHAMMKEFPESLEVQGGPGEGNIRGIGGDQRLEDMTVEGVGKLEGKCSHNPLPSHANNIQCTNFLHSFPGQRPRVNSSLCSSPRPIASPMPRRSGQQFRVITWSSQYLSITPMRRLETAWSAVSTSPSR